jgi:outer membrane protein TolC
MSLRSLAFVLAAAVSAPSSTARADSPQVTGTADPVLAGLIAEALSRNPQLAAAEQLERAAAARPVQEGSRPGPTVGLFYQNDGVAPSLGREQMTMLGVSAGQEIPYPGKLGLRRQVAEAGAKLSGFDVERARLSLIGEVTRAYYGVLLARGLADLALEHRKVWEEVRETAKARYASAVGSQQDMLRAQIEWTRVQALHAQHHAEARARAAEINGLLGRPPGTPIETPATLAIAPAERPAEEVAAWSEAASPEIKSAAAAIERDERALALARLGSKPDFSVQGAVINRGGLPPMWQVGASVMLASRARANGALAEAQAQLAADKAALEGLRVRLRSVVEQRLAFLAAAEEIEATYREGLLRQGELAVRSAAASYAAGPGSQLGVLAAASTLIDDRTDYLRVIAAHEAERARLEEASLESPMGVDSLLMHGRSTTAGGGSMGMPSAPPNTRAAGAVSSAQPEMR